MHKSTEHCFGEVRAGPGCCAVLGSGLCEGHGSCPFYKPLTEYRKNMDKANARLRALPLSEQFNIARKYYAGRMPWQRRSENE